MIEYSAVKRLGFKKRTSHDSVYIDRYGRGYFWMEFVAIISFSKCKNEIIFNWNCDELNIKVYKNEELIECFDDFEEFIEFFEIFIK